MVTGPAGPLRRTHTLGIYGLPAAAHIPSGRYACMPGDINESSFEATLMAIQAGSPSQVCRPPASMPILTHCKPAVPAQMLILMEFHAQNITNSSLDPKISQVYHSAARLLQANHALTDFPFQVCFLHVWPGARNRETNYAALQQQKHTKNNVHLCTRV